MSTTTTLTGPGPRHSPEFQHFLGNLDWNKLAPSTKLDLWWKFQAEQKSPSESEADRVARELETRYGDAITVEARMTPMERLQWVHATGKTAKPVENPDPTPVPPGLMGERKLMAWGLARQRDDAVRRLQGYQRANDPSGAERVEREISDLDARLRGMRK